MSGFAQLARVVLVVALLAAAAVAATPSGRLPPALRGVMRVLRRDGAAAPPGPASVRSARKALAILLVLAAVALCLLR